MAIGPQRDPAFHEIETAYQKGNLVLFVGAGGDLTAARGFFDKALELFKALAAADPHNADGQIDLAIAHVKLIGLALAMKDPVSLRTHQDAATAILDDLDRAGLGKGNAMVGNLREYLASLKK